MFSKLLDKGSHRTVFIAMFLFLLLTIMYSPYMGETAVTGNQMYSTFAPGKVIVAGADSILNMYAPNYDSRDVLLSAVAHDTSDGGNIIDVTDSLFASESDSISFKIDLQGYLLIIDWHNTLPD